MGTSNELSQLTKYRLFINHLRHDDYLAATAYSVISKYFDYEVDPFMESFHQAISDARLVAHAMIPSTPAATRLRGRAVAEVPHPPPLPGGQIRKRKAPAGHDSRKKRVSLASDSTACYDSDVTTILSDTSFQEREASRPTRQLPRRCKRNRVEVTRTASSVSRVTRSSSRARTDESISETKVNIQSPSTLATRLSNSATLLSQPPDRPAPPSFMESSAPSTPPDRPSPPSSSVILRPTGPSTPDPGPSTPGPSVHTPSIPDPSFIPMPSTPGPIPVHTPSPHTLSP